ncbi:MAG: hypothetical protein CTY38_01110 [Methylotenera sp.]|uniref:hypothetical protein n=1 Tax=Methylotenera sp. TaxID=2051956 RepID=UPI000D4E51BE|nr:hypothetical protein [Methylotenera sp.]PPC84676.1 MAG: hypothetical protein CTY38_01110 [Methylotenera sp.]
MEVKVSVYVEPVRNGCALTFKSKDFIVKPHRITRRETGRGTGRYYYTAHFIGFGEMITVLEKSAIGVELYSGINRSQNPSWKPPKDGWIGNTLNLS